MVTLNLKQYFKVYHHKSFFPKKPILKYFTMFIAYFDLFDKVK